jgi:ribonucleoside-diphosphate reductase alpha chain
MGVGEMRELTPEEALKFQAWLERSSTDSGHKVGTRTPEEEQKFRDPKEEQEFQDWVNSHRYRTSVHQDLKIKPKERPDTLTGHTVKIQTGCGKLYVTVNFGEDGNPVELFARHGKAGVCSQAQCEAIGRLGSMSLRSGVDPQAVVDQLRGITCHETAGMGPSKVLSCADGIAQALIKALTVANPPAPGDDPSATHFKPVYSGACPMCGAGAVREGGCAVCKACGWTKCS